MNMHGVDRSARTLFFWGHTTCIPCGNSFNRGESPASARCHESLNKNPELTNPFFPNFGCIKHTNYRDVQSPPKVQHTSHTNLTPGLAGIACHKKYYGKVLLERSFSRGEPSASADASIQARLIHMSGNSFSRGEPPTSA